MSLRARLLLGTSVVALVLVVSAVAITATTRSQLVDQVDARLRDAVPQLRTLLGGGPRGEAGPRVSDLYVGVIGTGGQLTALHVPDLRGDDPPLPRPDPDALAALRDGDAVTVPSDDDDTRYRLLVRASGPRGRAAVVGLALDDVDATVRRLVAVEVAALAVALGVLAVVVGWVIRLGVRPIREMTEAASVIAAGDLERQVPEGRAGTEAGALGRALNVMLGRLREALAARTASEARLRRFVADASHELRTPVTTIRGYAELYRTGALTEPGALADAMARTEAEAERMGRLVEDLLRLARLDEGRPLAREQVDLAALAADAVRDARAAEPDRAVTLEASPVAVDGDEDALRQVLANLLTNALVHAPGAPVTVRVRAEGTTAVVEVADAGPGMAPEDAARAFERFYRADPARRRARGGSGLGLSLVEAIARGHGGRASLTSEPGRGTTVRVELPVAVGAAAGAAHTAQAPAAGARE